MGTSTFAYPRFFAHRGGGALAPENTLAGIALAARLGFAAVEFDVMLCADGVPVLIHDETLERTTDAHGAVARTSLARLQAVDAGGHCHPAYAGERLPTLAQAWALCQSLGLSANVEIKPATGHDEATGAAVGRLLCGADPRRILLSSFAPAALAAARLAAPALPRALLLAAPAADWAAQLQALGGVGLHCAAAHFSAALAAALQAAAVPCACYTVNCPEQAARLFAAGASALFTDRLDLFAPQPRAYATQL